MLAPVERDELAEHRAGWQDRLELQVKTGEMSPDTARTYLGGFERFVGYCKAHRPGGIAPDVVRMWLSAENEQYSVSTVNTWLSAVKNFFGYLVERQLLLADPTDGVRGPKRKNTNKRYKKDILTDAEVKRLLAQPDNPRDAAILYLMAYTGCRKIEVHRANYEDLRSNGHMVLSVVGKGGAERDLVIYDTEAQEKLREWLSVRGYKNGALFVSMSNRSSGERLSRRMISQIVNKYFRAAGIVGKQKTAHSLRHTAISKVAQHDLQKAQQVAGHANINTTMIYVHQADRLTDPGEQYIKFN